MLHAPDAATLDRARERWAALLQAHSGGRGCASAPAVTLETKGELLINALLGRCEVARPELVERFKRRKEVHRKGMKTEDEDLESALTATGNPTNIDEAVRRLQQMRNAENNLVSKRAGHSTRLHVRHALKVTGFNESSALWLLQQQKDVERNIELITKRLGLTTGLGWPSRDKLEAVLTKCENEEGNAMATLKKEWRLEVEMMADIIGAADVDEMLSQRSCREFAFGYPAAPAERAHVEELYYGERSASLAVGEVRRSTVAHFLREAGAVLRQGAQLGSPTRQHVEELLLEMGGDASKVIEFLQAIQSPSRASPPSTATRARTTSRATSASLTHSLEKATAFVKLVWKIANPKEKKPTKKDAKVPEHLAAKCGFPSRSEVEWALLNSEPPLDQNAAVNLLCQLAQAHADAQAANSNNGDGAAASVTRADAMWALEPARGKALLAAKPLSHDEIRAGHSPASVLLAMVGGALASLTAAGVQTAAPEVWAALERFAFDEAAAQRWLHGVGALLQRQSELNITSREEIEAAMGMCGNEPEKVVELMVETAALEAQASELNRPARDDIKRVLSVTWEMDGRKSLAPTIVKAYMAYTRDDTALLNIGLQGAPTEADKTYMVHTLARFGGDAKEALGFMKKVSDIVNMGVDLGEPTRDDAIAALEEHKLEQRAAVRALRDAHRKVLDARLKEEYRKNREAASATGGASVRAQ